MTTSGTISETVFTTRKVVDNAVRRTKMTAQQITAEHIDIAKDALYLLLSDLANQGAPLWCIERVIYPFYRGVDNVPLGAGTVDVLDANLRTLQEVTGTNTDTATARSIEFESSTQVTTVGIQWSAASAPLTFARSSDGSTWTTIQTETPTEGVGEWSWYDLSPAISALYFRITASSGTLDFDSIYTGNTPNEVPLARLNRNSYASLPNKAFPSSRPTSYWLDRQQAQPYMRLWPVPNTQAEDYQAVVWRQRYIQDVGTLTQTLDIPQRWYEAVVSMLAAKLAAEYAEVDPQLIPMLDSKATQALYWAQQEERDKSPINFAPNISPYTR